MTLFQSTPPVKAATVYTFCIIFNCDISIHAAREGGDAVIAVYRDIPHIFQSTPPVKAATGMDQQVHFLRLFQSTPPVKAATIYRQFFFRKNTFQSTPPVKAAT